MLWPTSAGCDGGMISISSVKVTPDLLEARFYLSLFQVKDVEAALKKIEEKHHEIKKELAAKVRHQLRSIPVLRFFPGCYIGSSVQAGGNI